MQLQSTTAASPTSSAPPTQFRTRADLFSYLTSHPAQLLCGSYSGHVKSHGDPVSQNKFRIVIDSISGELKENEDNKLNNALPHPHHFVGRILTPRIHVMTGVKFMGKWDDETFDIDSVTGLCSRGFRVTIEDDADGGVAAVHDPSTQGSKSEKETHLLIKQRRDKQLTTSDIAKVQQRHIGSDRYTRLFFESVEQMNFHLEWRPNRQPINVYGEGRLCITGKHTHSSSSISSTLAAKEYATIECTLDQSSLYQSLAEGESPISSQPVSSLAIMCRYMDGRDLISVYKVSRIMSQAASHPIVHQSGQSVGIASALNTPSRSYVTDGGITCTFTSHEKMQLALSGRLLRPTRILRIRSFAYTLTPLTHFLQYLTNADITPSLRALRIEAANIRLEEETTQLFLLEVAKLPLCSAFTHLKLVHLAMRTKLMELILPHLPESVELLHLTFTEDGVTALPSNLLSIMRDSNHHRLTRIIFSKPDSFRGADGIWFQYPVYKLLLQLSEIEQISHGHQVHFDFVVSLIKKDAIVHASHPRPTHQLRMPSIRLHIDCGELLTAYLGHFSSLTRLCLRTHSRVFENLTKSSCNWPSAVVSSLKELRFDFSAGYFNDVIDVIGSNVLLSLETLVLTSSKHIHNVNHDLPRLFRTMPNLTRVQLPRIVWYETELTHFALLPHLRTIADFDYPTRTRVNDPQVNLSAVFPSLTSLKIARTSETSMPTHALRSIPHLIHLKWLKDEWLHGRDGMEEKFALIESTQPKEPTPTSPKVQPSTTVDHPILLPNSVLPTGVFSMNDDVTSTSSVIPPAAAADQIDLGLPFNFSNLSFSRTLMTKSASIFSTTAAPLPPASSYMPLTSSSSSSSSTITESAPFSSFTASSLSSSGVDPAAASSVSSFSTSIPFSFASAFGDDTATTQVVPPTNASSFSLPNNSEPQPAASAFDDIAFSSPGHAAQMQAQSEESLNGAFGFKSKVNGSKSRRSAGKR